LERVSESRQVTWITPMVFNLLLYRYARMVKTLDEEKASRQEAASQLQSLASQLRSDSFDIDVGNRTLHLRPPEEIGLEIGVREPGGFMRGNRETVTVKMDWRPAEEEPQEIEDPEE